MFIKNYSDTDFVIKYKGEQKTLPTQDVTYVDDRWISFSMVSAMFGGYVGLIEGDIPLECFLFDNQIKVEPDKVYTVEQIGPGTPRVFINNGKATLYFAEGLKPESVDDMIPSSVYTNVQGLIVLPEVTMYMGVKTEDNADVIFTNIKVA